MAPESWYCPVNVVGEPEGVTRAGGGRIRAQLVGLSLAQDPSSHTDLWWPCFSEKNKVILN